MSVPKERRASSGSGPARRSISRALIAHILTDAGMVLGGALALAAFITLVKGDGGLAYDTRAYWLAAKHVLDGSPLYAPATVSTLGAYKYPPLFAQLFAPAALMPELLVAWLWRLSGILCLRYMVGSWRAAVVCCLFIPVLTELSLGNVTLQIGALLLFALRDRRGAWFVPWVVALKFGPALVVPFLWFRRPESRRGLVLGSLLFGGACLLSYAIAPGAWSDYVATFGWENDSLMYGSQVVALLPAAGGLDFALRFGVGTAIALLAAYKGRAWLAYVAAVVTCPVLAVSRFAPLVGLWRFRRGADPEGLPAGPDVTVPDAKP